MELSTVHSKDNDQISAKVVYLEESNRELTNFRKYNKQNFIDTGCSCLRTPGSDVSQAIYAITRILPNMNNITKTIKFS